MAQDPSFAQLVKQHRKALDLTQAELARRVGCATITLRKIEAESLRPSVQIAERLAMAINIPLDERADFVRFARAATLQTPEPPGTPTPPPLPEEIGTEDLSGRAVRGYYLGERLGSGGFGAVYRAVQPGVEREVAVKIILPQYANHPDFIRRFEAEAQLVARLEHPHIVPLYDYWREPNAAYLVMRLLRGGSLHDLLKKGPLLLPIALQFFEQIGNALHAAHRYGVIHRDLKPANILLDEDQNAYLADFGVAKSLGSPDLRTLNNVETIVGSPAYISPEQIRGDPIRPQTDIYCLGVVLYELLTGHLPFKGPTPIDQIMQHLNDTLPLLSLRNPELPQALDPIIQKATAKDPAERYSDVLDLLADLRSVVRDQPSAMSGTYSADREQNTTREVDNWDLAIDQNPYKGLRPFGEADADDFYGRETLIQDLLGRLGEEGELSRFLVLVGPSGSGKSSVVKAGLIPAIRRGALPGSENWFVVDFMPGFHPLEELEAALLRIAVNPPDSLLAQLKEDPRGLLRVAKRILPTDEAVELFIVIDQFEEVFTLVTDEAARTHFLESLLTAVLEPRSRLHVLLTLRADFTDRPLQYVDFGDLLRQRTEFILPLSTEEIELAITAPAKNTGLLFEPGLTSRIIRDLGDQPGVLPLLQYALTELFDHRVGRTISLDAYQEIGGVLGALGRRAEEVFASLYESAQSATRQMFLRLVTLGEGVEDTRRRVLRSELESLSTENAKDSAINTQVDEENRQGFRVSDEFHLVIDIFGKARLLTFDTDPFTRSPTVEVAHEALLREWPRLRGWLNESRGDLRMQRQLTTTATEWQNADRDSSFLLRGTRLTQFEGWSQATMLVLTQNERDYLSASLVQREKENTAEADRQVRETRLKQRVQRALQALVGLFLLAAVVSGALALWANNQRMRAEEAGQEALRQAGIGLAAQARLELDSASPERSVLLALEALENYPYSWQAEQALGQIVHEFRLRRIVSGHTAIVSDVAWSPDGTRFATSSRDGTVKVWDTGSWDELLSIPAHAAFELSPGESGAGDTGVLALAWSPDGRQIATLGKTDGTASVWDAKSGEKITTFTAHSDWLSGMAWSPDGERIATASKDGTAQVWDSTTGERWLTLSGHSGSVNTVAWSPDGEHIATAGDNGTIKLWDTEKGKESLTLSGHTGVVRSAAWSPDGNYLASVGEDGTIRIWNGSTGAEQSDIRSPSPIWHVTWSPDGSLLASANADGTARIWDPSTGTEIFALSGRTPEPFTVTWSPDGEWLATSGGADLSARIWTVSLDQLTLSGTHTESVWWAMWSPEGGHIVTAGDDLFPVLWDAQTGEAIQTLSTHADWIQQAKWSPDGTRIATASWDNTVRLWDLNVGQEILTFTGHAADPPSRLVGRSGILNLIWSPDSTRIASAGLSGWVRVWRSDTGEELISFRTNEDLSEVMEWSPEGEQIATCAEPHFLQMWDATTGETIYGGFVNNTTDLTLDDFAPECINISWSPKGETLVSTGWGSPPATVWDAETGKQLRSFTRHTTGATGVAWSPNGLRVATGDNLGVVKVWDPNTGTELFSFKTPYPTLWTLDWSPDGSHLAGAGGLLSATVWRVWQSAEELINYTRECCVVRQLTLEERQQFGLPISP